MNRFFSRMNLKQYQCQAPKINVPFFLRLGLLFIICTTFISCAQKWDPDLQFSNNIKTILVEKEIADWQSEQRAIENLKLLDLRLRQELRIGTSTIDFLNLVGQTGTTLASQLQNEVLWESRSYLWHQIVSHNFGVGSPEYDKCSKSKNYLEVTFSRDRVASLQFF